jgi:2-amino-4-hydroxy-6-hydroxymethyldihydropteridine diphosphokinase
VHVVDTDLTALETLGIILNIEKKYGRERDVAHYSSRTLDIDILYFGNQVLEADVLTIPHPRLHKRMFTLRPLAEIAPDFIHPVLKLTNKDLLERTNDKLKVWKYEAREA